MDLRSFVHTFSYDPDISSEFFHFLKFRKIKTFSVLLGNEPSCPNENQCNSHGTCINTDTCQCDYGWSSSDCSVGQLQSVLLL